MKSRKKTCPLVGGLSREQCSRFPKSYSGFANSCKNVKHPWKCLISWLKTRSSQKNICYFFRIFVGMNVRELWSIYNKIGGFPWGIRNITKNWQHVFLPCYWLRLLRWVEWVILEKKLKTNDLDNGITLTQTVGDDMISLHKHTGVDKDVLLFTQLTFP